MQMDIDESCCLPKRFKNIGDIFVQVQKQIKISLIRSRRSYDLNARLIPDIN